jgi:DNA-binding transcriptional LysR family regulator
MTEMQIDFRQLRQFLAVVELKSFTAAAERLHMTQPALTRSVQQIEERFGVKLIERGSKTFDLTPFGHMLAERARLIEQEFAHIDSEMAALKSGETGTLRIGTGVSAIGYLPNALAGFREQRPNVSVRVTVDSMDSNVAALLRGDLDLICTAIEFPRHPTLKSERLLEVGNVVIASKSHPLADRGKLTPKDLHAYPWATFRSDELARARLGAYFAASELDPPRLGFETNNLEILFAMLARSDYLASVPSLVLDDARSRGLAPLRIKGSFWSIGLGYAHVRTAHLPSALSTFITILRSQILALKPTIPNALDA